MITKINIQDRTIKSYAIRKLTPFECFRLMGVRDAVIRIMQSVRKRLRKGVEVEEPIVSASQQYKQAGNSIVVDVLTAIYKNIWFPIQEDNGGSQLSLFDAHQAEPQRRYSGSTVNILTTFSGYDSQLMAADVLKERHPDFKWRCVGWSEIDKYACQMHDLVFPQYADKALGDITKIDWQAVKDNLGGEDVDLFTYSSPCQDISQAGKQEGLKEGSGTRSALVWYVAKAIEVLKPKYLLMENVAALVSKKFMPDFSKWCQRLESLGYVNVWARLNAKDFNVPQNRDRVFVLSMRKDVAFNYKFPQPMKLTKTLESVLEEEVDERYFLNDEQVGKFLKANDNDNAVFHQFPIPPSHEDAMFIKTWLQQWMADKWDYTAQQVEAMIPHDELVDAWQHWKGTDEMPNAEFGVLFRENMDAKK